jgi:ribosomal protein S7
MSISVETFGEFVCVQVLVAAAENEAVILGCASALLSPVFSCHRYAIKKKDELERVAKANR